MKYQHTRTHVENFELKVLVLNVNLTFNSISLTTHSRNIDFLDEFGLAIGDLKVEVITRRSSVQLWRMRIGFDEGIKRGSLLDFAIISSSTFTTR